MPDSCAKALSADDRLVRRGPEGDELAQHLAGGVKLIEVEAAGDAIAVAAHIKAPPAISSEPRCRPAPMPLMVHSTCRAPFWMAASEFGRQPVPRSSWQCEERIIPWAVDGRHALAHLGGNILGPPITSSQGGAWL